MNMQFKSLKTVLIGAFLLLGLTPVIVVSIASFISASNEIEEQSFAQLESINAIKKETISRYFLTIKDQMLTFSEDQMVIDAMSDFKTSYYKYSRIMDSAITILPE